MVPVRRPEPDECGSCGESGAANGYRCLIRGGKRAGPEGSCVDPRLRCGGARRRPARSPGCRLKARGTAMNAPQPNTYRSGPDERGHFGLYGGRFVAETLMPLILELETAYEAAKQDPAFNAELTHLNTHYTGRPSPLYFAERLTEHLREISVASGERGGAKIYFKRDELNHTGSHKI